MENSFRKLLYHEPCWKNEHSRWDLAAPGPSSTHWVKQSPHRGAPANGASRLLPIYSIQQKAHQVPQPLAYCLTLSSLTLSSC